MTRSKAPVTTRAWRPLPPSPNGSRQTPTNSDDPDVLILGDLNAYDEEDPIDQLKADGYTDLVEAFQGEFAYSYVFSGEFGHLDYALANEALFPQVTGTTEWHINADEPDLLDYNTDFKDSAQIALYEPNPYRSSDHDPVVVGLALTSDGEVTPSCNGQEATVYVQNGTIIGGRDDGDAYNGVLFGTTGDDVIVGTSENDEIRAQQGDDLVCAGAGDDIVQGNAGNDAIFGEDGDDQLSGNRGDEDRLFGGVGDDRIVDRSGGNLGAHGGPGDDRINVLLERGWRGGATRYDGKLSGGYGDDSVTLESQIHGLFINITGDERDNSAEGGQRDRLLLKGDAVKGGSVIIKFERVRRR